MLQHQPISLFPNYRLYLLLLWKINKVSVGITPVRNKSDQNKARCAFKYLNWSSMRNESISKKICGL
jgi:hypothetical protein